MKKGEIYKHFKTGNLYKILEIAKDSETLEDFVVYEAQYENPVSKNWIRPMKMFLEEVEWPKGSDIKVPRFELQATL